MSSSMRATSMHPSADDSENARADEMFVANATNAEGLAALYDRHVTRIYRYALSRCGNQQDAEDITAQTFLAMLENLHRYRPRANASFAAWLTQIARNKATDLFRSGRRTVSFDDVDTVPMSVPPSDTGIDAIRRERQLIVALATLAPDRAEAIRLRMFASLSMAEIGKTMNKSEAAAKMLVSRGLSDLRAALAQHAEWMNDGDDE
jgi:RNA polymerase sigma-70 factor, ECF subfamily